MMGKIVFHIITRFDVGGAEKVAVSIADASTSEYSFHVVEVTRGKGEFNERFLQDLKQKHIPFHRSHIRSNKLGIILFPFRLLLLVVKHHPVIIHTHTEIPDLSVYLYHILFGWMSRNIRYARTIHNTQLWDHWHAIGREVERFFIKHHSNVAISYSVRHSYERTYGQAPPIIFNGVKEVDSWSFESIDPGKTNILFAGRLEYPKGIDVLIEVIKRSQDIKDLVFWIVGSGSQFDLVSKSLLTYPNVHYRSKLYGLPHYLASFDYLFMPSVFEGLALLPIEASLAKVPSIINDCPGLSDTLPKDWPLKVKDNSVDKYLSIFSNLKEYDRECLEKTAYSFAKKQFSIELMQENYILFYRNLEQKQ